MSSLRQRPRRTGASGEPEALGHDEPDSSNGHADTPATTDEDEDEDEDYSDDDNIEIKTNRISVLDVLRVISVLVFASCALSYYVTSSESVIWGYKRPWFTKLPELKRFIRGPLHLTPAELSLYNGTSPTLPVYLAVNGTIYDVSEGRHVYGPGGSYSFFAGRDATRAYVTGCFREDLTDDMRGVEEMFIPIEDVEDDDSAMDPVERGMSTAAKRARKAREMDEAREKVRKTVEKWQNFYKNHAKYFEVGKVAKNDEDEAKEKARPLCEAAKKSRPKRSVLMKKEKEKQQKREKGKS